MSLFEKNIYSHLSKTKTPESVILWLKDNKNKHKPERHISIKGTNILSQIVSHKDKKSYSNIVRQHNGERVPKDSSVGSN